MSEKLKTQQRDNELERLAHELELRLLNQESTQQAEPDNRSDSLSCSHLLKL